MVCEMSDKTSLSIRRVKKFELAMKSIKTKQNKKL